MKIHKVFFLLKSLRPLDLVPLAAFVAAIWFCMSLLFSQGTSRQVLVVHSPEGRFAYSMDRDTRVEIKGNLGSSWIVIKDGCAWFESSPCDNKICVETGKITMERQWAACMPNGVMIHIEGKSKKHTQDLDAVVN